MALHLEEISLAIAPGAHMLVLLDQAGWHERRISGGDEPEIRNHQIVLRRIVKDIRRATRKQYSDEEKFRIVLDGLRGEHSIAELCRREGIIQNLYYRWSKDFLEAGKKRLAGDTARAATSEGRRSPSC